MKKALWGILVISLALTFINTGCFAADAKNIVQTDQVQYVNINTASKDLLMTLPSIDDSLAQKIIDNRPYKNKEDLKTKKIIPASIYEKIKGRIVTRSLS
ncbi:MAG TPA: helix-hairpin-helix domain-containing protein [Syntrophales bacterium]|nr:helix-hairpin-helix domain-containing protein [Syntrophales bacterium]